MPKIYRLHNCARRHRTFRAMAACVWRRAEWVAGEGPNATVAYCGVATVELHRDLAEAQAAMQRIDETGCGHACSRRHDLIELRLDGQDVADR